MMQKFYSYCLRPAIAIVLAMVLSQCADKAEPTNAAAESSKPRSMNERFNSRGKEGYYQDSEGNWKIKNNKRSSFENAGQAAYGNKQFQSPEYKPGTVQKKSWWGNRDYERKIYAGNTDGSKFATTARDAGKSANESGSASRFSGKNLESKRIDRTSALEEGTLGITTPSDAETNERRALYKEPSIIDYQQQRALQIQQTKSMLGR